jgi:hypothetical protein
MAREIFRVQGVKLKTKKNRSNAESQLRIVL